MALVQWAAWRNKQQPKCSLLEVVRVVCGLKIQIQILPGWANPWQPLPQPPLRLRGGEARCKYARRTPPIR